MSMQFTPLNVSENKTKTTSPEGSRQAGLSDVSAEMSNRGIAPPGAKTQMSGSSSGDSFSKAGSKPTDNDKDKTEKPDPENEKAKKEKGKTSEGPPTSVSVEDIRHNAIGEQHESMADKIISETENAFGHDDDRLIPTGIGGSEHGEH